MGQYEPEDSRNITGTAATADGRWTNKEGKPPTGVPDEKPADAQDAAVKQVRPDPDAQPPMSDEPAVPDRDQLPGTPRPAERN